jgi:hypothetical protein
MILKTGAIVDIETTDITNNRDSGVLLPVLPNFEIERQDQNINYLIELHDVADGIAGMSFRYVTIGEHPNTTWRIDEGYHDVGEYVVPEFTGLE